MKKILVITGTNTGVGKTLLSGLLLFHLRFSKIEALAMKPIATGSRHDARFLNAIQDRQIAIDEVNPCFFPEPLAPYAAARRQKRYLNVKGIVQALEQMRDRCDCLIIEGAGGLLTPLGKGIALLDLLPARRFPRAHLRVVVVAPNQLGVINHLLLTLAGLKQARIRDWRVVLMNGRRRDLATETNPGILRQLIGTKRLHHMDYLGPGVKNRARLARTHKKVKKILAQVLSDQ